jgi:SAM-dependent methyltransferase
MKVDLIEEISLASVVHEDTIFPFMRKALRPEASSNANIDRFDNQLIEFAVNPTEPVAILDLGCGDLLLLQKILKQHDDGCLLAPVSYFGRDTVEHKTKAHWLSLEQGRCRTCFPIMDYRKLHLDETDTVRRELAALPKFDLIVLSNVLHELSPRPALALLELLHGRLTSKGKLLVLDPDWSWCASGAAWEPAERKGESGERKTKGERHLNDVRIEWEADAIWLSHAGAQSILRAVGFNAVIHAEPRPSMQLWACLCDPKPTASVEAGTKALKEHLELQIEIERSRIVQLRHDLRDRFARHSRLTGDMLIKMFEFFATCASQCRRLEALKDLSS